MFRSQINYPAKPKSQNVSVYLFDFRVSIFVHARTQTAEAIYRMLFPEN